MKIRPDVLTGTTKSSQTGCGKIYVTINRDKDGQLFELFTSIGKAGGCAASQVEAIGRLVSLAFRCDIHPKEVIKQLKGIQCHQGNSCAEAIRVIIESEYNK